MDKRLKLHEVLVGILGSRNVYYQPPANVKMNYPAIRYERASIDNAPADNRTYKQDNLYQITVIDPNPDSRIVYRVSQLPRIRFDRHYTADNLNHDVFTLYFH